MSEIRRVAKSIRPEDPVTELLSRLRLDYRARERGALVVEGPTDKVLASVFSIDSRAIFPAAGRPNVLSVARRLAQSPLKGVVCVCDRDFDETEANWRDPAPIVFYDDADLEAMIVYSSALDRFLSEWASSSKLRTYGGARAVRQTLANAVIPVSALRAANAQAGLGICFDAINLEDVVDKRDGSVRVDSLVGRLATTSGIERVRIEEALSQETVCECPHSNRRLSRGRDLIALLAVLMRHVLASLSRQQVANGFVEKSLRLSLRDGAFDQTPFAVRLTAARTAAAQS